MDALRPCESRGLLSFVPGGRRRSEIIIVRCCRTCYIPFLAAGLTGSGKAVGKMLTCGNPRSEIDAASSQSLLGFVDSDPPLTQAKLLPSVPQYDLA